jgi:hypothetical protein
MILDMLISCFLQAISLEKALRKLTGTAPLKAEEMAMKFFQIKVGKRISLSSVELLILDEADRMDDQDDVHSMLWTRAVNMTGNHAPRYPPFSCLGLPDEACEF